MTPGISKTLRISLNAAPKMLYSSLTPRDCKPLKEFSGIIAKLSVMKKMWNL